MIVNGSDRRDTVNVSKLDGRVDVAGLAAAIHILDSEPALDTLQVNTLGGNDDVFVGDDVADLIATHVDLGTGE